MLKKFRQVLDEAKTDLEHGVVLKKTDSSGVIRKKGSYLSGKADKVVPAQRFEVHLHGHHIGHVEQSTHQPYKKITGSRLVKPMAERVVWRPSTTGEAVRQHGVDHYRTAHNHHTNKESAANNLARHFSDKIKGE